VGFKQWESTVKMERMPTLNKERGRVILVLGPASSGKSEWAEQLAKNSQRSVIYVATAIADSNDPAWQKKLQKHALRRPKSWSTQEVPTALPDCLRQQKTEETCLLIDALGTWVANLLNTSEAEWNDTVNELLADLKQTSAEVNSENRRNSNRSLFSYGRLCFTLE